MVEGSAHHVSSKHEPSPMNVVVLKEPGDAQLHDGNEGHQGGGGAVVSVKRTELGILLHDLAPAKNMGIGCMHTDEAQRNISGS